MLDSCDSTVADVSMTSNVAGGAGGGVYSGLDVADTGRPGSYVFESSGLQMSSNQANGGDGGGLAAAGVNVSISGSFTGGDSFAGGALSGSGSSSSSSSSWKDNVAQGNGGAVAVSSGGTLIVTGIAMEGNLAGGSGGAVSKP